MLITQSVCARDAEELTSASTAVAKASSCKEYESSLLTSARSTISKPRRSSSVTGWSTLRALTAERTPLSPGYFEHRVVRSTAGDGNVSQGSVRESQHSGSRSFQHRMRIVLRLHRHALDLVSEYVAQGIDAMDADVRQRPPGREFGSCTQVRGLPAWVQQRSLAPTTAGQSHRQRLAPETTRRCARSACCATPSSTAASRAASTMVAASPLFIAIGFSTSTGL